MPGAETDRLSFSATEIAMGDGKLSIMSLSLPRTDCMAECQPMPSFIKSATFFRIARTKSVTMFMEAVDLTKPSLELMAMDHVGAKNK